MKTIDASAAESVDKGPSGPVTLEAEIARDLGFVVVKGADKHQVGQVAAEIRALRPPDPYKNKGVRYTSERLKKKAGKAAAGAGVAKQ